MTKYATVVIAYALTPRWAQITIASLKEHKSTRDCEIYLMNNHNFAWTWPPYGLVTKAEGYWDADDIKCVSQTSLGEGVHIINTSKYPGREEKWPGPGPSCDLGVEIAINETKTPYLFTMDSDFSINRDGWLDWYASFMKDDYVAMAGFWWDHPGRLIVNPCGTLYNMRIIKQLLEEVKLNKDEVTCYGLRNEKRHDFKSEPHYLERIKTGRMGVFGEQRGFIHNIFHYVGPFFFAGKPDTSYNSYGDKYWHEFGNWLHNRAANQWECVSVPGAWIENDRAKEPNAPQFYCNYYGDSLENSYACHYWGGTSAHNFKVGPTWSWFAVQQEWTLKREYELWKKYVPEFIRKESLEKGYIEDFDTELKYALSRQHIINTGDYVKVYPYDAQLCIMKGMPLRVGIEGEKATVKGGTARGRSVMFDEKPKYEFPYLREEGGKWYADIINDFWIVRR